MRGYSSIPSLLLLVLALHGAQSQAPTSAPAATNPLSAHARFMYLGMKQMLVQAADKMPDEKYGFRATEAVRTFGQGIGHVADWQFRYCATVLGEQRAPSRAEQTLKTKAEFGAILRESLAYCDRAYDTMTDAEAVKLVRLGGRDMPKLGVLNINLAHDASLYGNFVVYLRLNGIVPPTSEPGAIVLPPPM